MANIPSIELLQATHEFPGAYTFKVIGHSNQFFVPRVVAAIRDELKFAVDPPFHLRESANKKHVSIGVDLMMESAEQVHQLYERLLTVPDLILLL